MATQSSFAGPMERTEEVLERAARLHGDADHIVLATSGGTDSLVAADVVARKGPDYGLDADVVFHANTGTGVPQTLLAAQVFAALHGLAYIEGTPYREQDKVAPQVLENGWPGAYPGSFSSGGHAVMWATRKDRPMDGLYSNLPGKQIWISGGRLAESDRRSSTVANSAIDRKERRNRRVWVQPIHSWSDEEKRDYLLESNIPVSEAYLVMGHSGECNACSFDDAGLLDDLDLLAPEMARALRYLAAMVYAKVRSGELDIPPKKLRWGWEPDTYDEDDVDDGQTTLFDSDSDAERAESMEIVGCSSTGCSDRNIPDWIRDLDADRVVDRADVLDAWDGNAGDVVDRFRSLE